MSAKAFNKIAAGLNEALSVARGESDPARVRVIRSTPVAPAKMEMINEKSTAETSPRKT